MENIIYNELRVRGYNVDVGMVEHESKDSEGNRKKKQLEVDFICNKGSLRYYIQSAYSLPDEVKRQQEKESLIHINDMFKKIIIVKDNIKLYRDEDGIVTIGLREFLTNPNSLEL
jgi:predicted AAA+ superfamily ATPase